MNPNPRLFIRSLQDSIINHNPVTITILLIRKIWNTYAEIPQKTQQIAKNITNNKVQLEKTRTIIDLRSTNKGNSINLIR